MSCRPAIHFTAAMLSFQSITSAQVTYTRTTSADAFVATGSSNNPAGSDLTGLNFGAAGMLVVAPAASGKGEFQSLLRFNLAGAADLFNTNYGAGNWTITAVSVELASNYGTSNVQPNNLIFPIVRGGQFGIEWLAHDDWAEGTGTPNLPTTDGVTFNSLGALLAGAHEVLFTNSYSPPGNDVHVTWALPLNASLVADVASGGEVSLRLYAADAQIGYLFNSHSYGRGNEPQMHVTAAPSLRILSGAFTNGSFHLTGLGAANTTYQVRATTTLAATNWQTVGAILADNAGWMQFEDTTGTNQPQRFYRLAR